MNAPDGIDPAVAGRVGRLAEELAGLGVDALFVDDLIDLRYVTGFTGSHGMALVFAENRAGAGAGAGAGGAVGAGPHRFFSDFRYATQSGAQVPDVFDREISSGADLLEALADTLSADGGRLGFDDTRLTVARHAKLRELLGEGWELVPCPGAVERLRAVKEAGEIARIRAACELADRALVEALEGGLAGRTERDVAIDLELRMRRLGADANSFPTIVAAGSHGALPHAQPRDVKIPRDVLVTIDWGALHDGYCSDCTRTYATGEHVSAQARQIYELVLGAQRRGLDVVRAGPSGREVDALAREVIEQAGHGEDFGHGLGHGVGMEIHEGPRLSRTAPEDEPLRAGNVVTVEPGVYLPGVLGVRIEDLVVVRAHGCEALTGLSKDLTVVA